MLLNTHQKHAPNGHELIFPEAATYSSTIKLWQSNKVSTAIYNWCVYVQNHKHWVMLFRRQCRHYQKLVDLTELSNLNDTKPLSCITLQRAVVDASLAFHFPHKCFQHMKAAQAYGSIRKHLVNCLDLCKVLVHDEYGILRNALPFFNIEFLYVYFPVLLCLSVSVKWLAVKTASEMTYIVSGGALNSTHSLFNMLQELSYMSSIFPCHQCVCYWLSMRFAVNYGGGVYCIVVTYEPYWYDKSHVEEWCHRRLLQVVSVVVWQMSGIAECRYCPIL